MTYIRRRCLAVALAATLPIAVFWPVRPAIGAAGAPTASVAVAACQSASMYADRALEFRGTMNSLGAGGAMQMRFTLYRRYLESRSARFRVVRPTEGSSLGQWLGSSDPAATTYIHNLDVTPVETFAAYRAKVQYRWLDASGGVLARVKRLSKPCRQTTGLPNLRITGVQQYPNPGTVYPQMPAAYSVSIRNLGRSSASLQTGFIVSGLAGGGLVDGTVDSTPLAALDTLPAGATMVRVLYGPACTGVLAVRVDPGNLVRESNERDNAFRDVC